MESKDILEFFKESIKNKNTWLPNLLTSSRLLGAFVIPFLFYNFQYTAAIIATGCFAATDFFDGKIARKTNGYSEFGRLLDPIVDKIFAVGLTLAVIPLTPIIAMNIVPEILIAIINYKSFNNNGNPKSSFLGKAKTFLLFSTIGLAYLSVAFNTEFLNILMAIASFGTFAMQSAVTYDYYKKADIKENKEEVSNKEKDEKEEKEPIKELSNQELIASLKKEKDELLKTQNYENKPKVKKLEKKQY